MNDHQTNLAARHAFESDCHARGVLVDDGAYDETRDRWIAIAGAVIDSISTEWPLRARVWTRTSGAEPEKVLEIEGVIGDTFMTVRHTQTVKVADADVPGLPELYPEQRLHESASTYAQGVFERHGIEGLEREIDRLLEKMTAARDCYRDGPVRQLLDVDPERARIAVQRGRGDATSLALELDGLQARIVEAQGRADPCGRASLILHVDKDKWDKYQSYQAYIDALNPN